MRAAPVDGSSGPGAAWAARTITAVGVGAGTGVGRLGRGLGVGGVSLGAGPPENGGVSNTPPWAQFTPALVMTHCSPQRRPALVNAQDWPGAQVAPAPMTHWLPQLTPALVSVQFCDPGAHGAPVLVTMHVTPSTHGPPGVVTKHCP